MIISETVKTENLQEEKTMDNTNLNMDAIGKPGLSYVSYDFNRDGKPVPVYSFGQPINELKQKQTASES
jgi:hypothetical protein